MYDTSQLPEIMQKRFTALPANIVELYEYGTVEVVVNNAARQFRLTTDQQIDLQMEVDLILYLFVSKNGLTDRLIEYLAIDKTTATGINNFLDDELFAIVANELQQASEILDQENQPNQPSVITSVIPENIKIVEPVATEPVATNTPETKNIDPNSVKPLRTFAEDVEISRNHGYGVFRPQEEIGEDQPIYSSSQDDIIKK